MVATTERLAAEVAAERRIEAERASARWLAIVLRAGVLAASAFIIAGLLLAILGGHGEPGTLDEALGRTGDPTPLGPRDLVHGLAHGQAPAFIEFGLLLLILTPTVRVAMTAGIFARQRDRVFTALALVVLVILLLGLAGIGA